MEENQKMTQASILTYIVRETPGRGREGEEKGCTQNLSRGKEPEVKVWGQTSKWDRAKTGAKSWGLVGRGKTTEAGPGQECTQEETS